MTAQNKQPRKTSNRAKQATTQNKQRRKTSNDAKQATTQNKQRRKTSNDAKQATSKTSNDEMRGSFTSFRMTALHTAVRMTAFCK